MARSSTTVSKKLKELIATWAEKWGISGLEDDLIVRFDHRLSRSLGLCRPQSNMITLNPNLRDVPWAQVEEVLCHETAHVAVYRLYGRACKPHGKEWAALVKMAGYLPRVRLPHALALTEQRKRQSSPVSFEHKCPVCHMVRYARRSVSRWRCALCVESGLEGKLVITKRQLPGSSHAS